MATKNALARNKYNTSFANLSAGEKASITRMFNAQSSSVAPVSGGAVRAEVGRIGVNGTKACLLEQGATVADLIEQADYELDTKKEGVLAQSTGRKVSLSTVVENGETYVITPEIKSA